MTVRPYMNDFELVTRLDISRCAFFFDVDGTLAEIQPRPELVFIPESTLDSLQCLQDRGGVVAVISGRKLDDLDRLLDPLRLPAAGVHGAERRDAEGREIRLVDDPATLARIGAELEEACAPYPELRVENKGVAFALHYREAPERESIARYLAESFAERYADLIGLQPGKCVFELKPKGASKGEVINSFMREAPFAGRLPLFIGDDLTDEAGFAAVNALQGLSLKVGNGPTTARQRLASVSAVADWLRTLLASTGGMSPIQEEQRGGIS